eukprot:CAMPEP_0184680752 /NCGR_PEP_ID=MMETSP0312-20130426/3659_1 /TAXON_ID=31354 /ORGANISM="Compsopogon coeruleus, Strain SAG 36.94" /LENGTH=162 /DNA_ID=CAMNT_0027131083 /DNA_START=366 /DNA_END=854 /DNA_ORIENTATION=+
MREVHDKAEILVGGQGHHSKQRRLLAESSPTSPLSSMQETGSSKNVWLEFEEDPPRDDQHSTSALIPDKLKKREHQRSWRPDPSLTSEQIRAARAQRNRESARRSRERQKLDRQIIEERVQGLFQENDSLRKVVECLRAARDSLVAQLQDASGGVDVSSLER